jgi:MoaA/NifB/PqqE/SkfB family radical SAM enzyme
MKALFLIVNKRCNINCSYCFYNNGHQERSSDFIHKNLSAIFSNKIASLNVKTVILTGGEPFLKESKKDSFFLIKCLKENGVKVIVNTSGTFLSESDLKKIIKLGIDRVDISIDSHIEKIHNKQRARYKDTVFTITKLLSLGYKNISTTTVVTKDNASSLSQTYKWLKNLGIKDIRFQPVFLPKISKKEKNLIFNSLKNILLTNKAEYTEKYIKLIKVIFSGKIAPKKLNCRMGIDYYVCDPKGNIYECFHKDNIIGNIFDDNIKTIIKNLPKNNKICVGTHCLSLFNNSSFWNYEN